MPQKFKVEFNDGLILTYKLKEDVIVNKWADLITAQSIKNCCPINHFTGYSSLAIIQNNINRLGELADLINLNVPDRVIRQDITQDSWRTSLQKMHIHFPDLKNDQNYEHLWGYLTEYNDLVHWLESTLINVWATTKFPSPSSTLRLTLDFNKSGADILDIPETSYPLFYPLSNFGDLLLHYTHVGKNAHEMFMMQDFECPADQFVPQRTFNASVRMHFYDNFHNSPARVMGVYNDWRKFYKDKGGIYYWGIDINDPKIAFGYLKIGEMESINDRPIPTTLIALNDFRNMLVTKHIISVRVQ